VRAWLGLLLTTSSVAGAGPPTPLAPLAPALSAEPLPQSGKDWPHASPAEALAALAAAKPADRQQRRWNYALAALADGRPDEALGALSVMAQDEPDLKLVPAFRLARARSLVEVRRFSEAIATLDDLSLRGDAEACAWRMRALAELGGHAAALTQMPCAKPALVARDASARAPFVYAATAAAIASEMSEAALSWLSFVPQALAETRLLRGEALLALGRAADAARQFEPLAASVSEPVRVRAAAGLLAAEISQGRIKPEAALARAEKLRFGWRGDLLERRLVVMSWDLALQARKARASLSAATTLLRYHPAEPRLPAMLSIVVGNFARWLQPGSGAPLPVAAGLMWDNRDLLPSGTVGDMLVRRLAARLKDEGLHERAAELLEHQMAFRAKDVAQGPLSIEVAELHLLGGKPQRALNALRHTADTLYPADMADARLRLEAIALFQLGEEGAALSLVEDVPSAADLRGELLWRQRDWQQLASARLPEGGSLSEVAQVRVLRKAIALAMTGDEPGLASLRRRFGPAFAGKPTAKAFAVLTAEAGEVSTEELATALAALPSAAAGGPGAELLDLAPKTLSSRQGPPSPHG